jgi:hypothetical protein
MRLTERTAAALFGAVVALAVVAPAAADEAVPAPAFRVEQETVDLGDVVAGGEAVAVFRFHNTGDADVHIVRAKPS